jgi:hypothetical protein
MESKNRPIGDKDKNCLECGMLNIESALPMDREL